MSKLQPAIFIVPVIALLLVIFMHRFLFKKTIGKTTFKRFTIVLIIVAFLLNLGWEMLQMPLYKGMSLSIQSAVFCALASLADVVMLLLYDAFALIYKNPFWVQSLTLRRILILALAGGTGAVLAEIRQVSFGNWTYSRSMPIIPVANVGLSPVLQFMMLPVIIYYLSFHLLKNTDSKKGQSFIKT